MPDPATLDLDVNTPLANKTAGVQNQDPSDLDLNTLPLSFNSKSLPRLGGYQNPATQRPEFSNTLSDIGTSLIPGAMGGVGEAFGGPFGGATGTGIGQFFRGPIAEGRAPQTSDIADALKAAGIYSGISVAGNLIGRIPGAIAARTAAKTAKGAQAVEEARQVATGGIPSPTNVEQEQNVLKARLAPVKAEETAAWQKVTQHAQNNTRSVPVQVGQTPGPNPVPIFQNQNVEGAIPLSQKTLQFLRDTQADIATNTVGPLNPQLSQAVRTLNQVSRDIVTDGQTGISYIPFAGAKQLRSDLGAAYRQQLTRSMGAGQKIGVPYGTAIGVGLRDTLGEDIENGLTSWGNDAIKDYAAAGEATKTSVKASVLNKLIAKNTDQVKGTLNVDNVINGLKQETSKDGAVFSAADRDKLSGLLLAAKNVSPAYPSTGTFRGTNFALSGLALMTGHEYGAAYFAGKEVIKNILGKETSLARIAAQLPSAPANSSQAKILTTAFLRGLGKGVSATLISPNGKAVPAHTDGNGNIVPDYQSQ